MDAGLAALIAGIAGAVGGIGGGAAGAFFTGRAMVRQVRDQATTEHGHWMREQRMEAYLTLLREWDRAHGELHHIWDRTAEIFLQDSIHAPEGDLEEMCNDFLDEASNAVTSTALAFERVAMLGPDSIDQASRQLEEALQGLRAVTEQRLAAPSGPAPAPRNQDWGPWNGADAGAAGERQNFVECVRQVLGKAPSASPHQILPGRSQ
ncbi:hypothetical protein [Streptomyces sp. NPDC008141]|uniref:hypothetical protein n=1 Tax=Streptomyces sp. NPDC008141 TaxID=3364815 RepID=UPI0036E6C8BF